VAAAVVSLAIGFGLSLTQAGAEYLLHRLTFVRLLPESPSSPSDAVYVLGGTSDSVKARLGRAAGLIGSGKATRVLLGARKEDCGRESLRALRLGIEGAECVAFEEAFFGTWSEAKALSRITRDRGYRRLILVTSPYHGRRVWESFSSTVEQPDVRLYLYLSSEPVDRGNLLPEYVKLLVYRAVLL
jgi:uncharacterized SAM-binding protein YcdF (DUF218 family)